MNYEHFIPTSLVNHGVQTVTGGYLSQVFTCFKIREPAVVMGTFQQAIEDGVGGYCIDAPDNIPAGSTGQWNKFLKMAHPKTVTREE